MPDRAVADLVGVYRSALVEMNDIRLAEDRGAKHWNRCVHRVQRAQLGLRETDEGRNAISMLIEDPVPTVALWAASHALFWSEPRARRHLESVATHGGAGSLEAKMTLREFDAGRLNHGWVPPKRG